jgi:REP element-mobilizing transposase RayT
LTPLFSPPRLSGVNDAGYSTGIAMHHNRLRRLDRITISEPIFFITTCTADRRQILASDIAFQIIRSELAEANSRHGWAIGRFVVMPDHLHFMCAPRGKTHAACQSSSAN